jgi:hypothetical protein
MGGDRQLPRTSHSVSAQAVRSLRWTTASGAQQTAIRSRSARLHHFIDAHLITPTVIKLRRTTCVPRAAFLAQPPPAAAVLREDVLDRHTERSAERPKE